MPVTLKDIAEELNISQPAVTKHIKNLENELHVQLFKRSKYGMILNENGKKLYSQIKDAIEKIEQNPYILVDIVYGVDFKKIDKIAMEIGIAVDSPTVAEVGASSI